MLPDQVKKRDGHVEDFEETNIITSMKKALDATSTTYPVDVLYDILEARYLTRLKKSTITVEKLQDYIENTLMREELYEAARAYIVYRHQREQFRNNKNVVNKIVDDYVDKTTWRVNENSNITYSYPAMQSMISGHIISNYTLNSIYPQNIADAHLKGDIHIHDLAMGTAAYCAGWSLSNLLLDGFGGVEGKISSKPPTHLSSAVDQMINFLGVLQNEFSGAQAFNSIDTFLAPYVKLDNLTLSEVKKCIENFVFGVNVGSRWGQSVFSNVTFDWKCPKDLENEPIIIQGKDVGFTYKDCQKEMDIINEAFWSVMSEGDANQMPFTFPIPTVNITEDFDYETPAAKLMLETTAKFGLPYFQNFINSGLNPSDVRSLCCRLQLSLSDLRKHTGGIFGAGDSTGSIGVVTINLARLGYLATSDEDFFGRLDYLLETSKDSLLLKRKVINTNLERGLFPYTKRYLGSFKNYFSTIGLVGGHECCKNFLKKGIETNEGKDFMLFVLKYMRRRIEEFTEATGDLFNLEASPAEGASYRLAMLDKKFYPDIILSGEDTKYLTNSTQLPVDYTDDLFEALDHQDSLQCTYTSGCVFHAFTGEKLNAEGVKTLIQKICSMYKLPYFSITPTFSVCPDHKYFSGEHKTCPTCGKDCLVFTRVVGYYRSTSSFNKGKKEEVKNRKMFSLVR